MDPAAMVWQQSRNVHYYSPIERHGRRSFVDLPVFLEKRTTGWTEGLNKMQNCIRTALTLTINLRAVFTGRVGISNDEELDILYHAEKRDTFGDMNTDDVVRFFSDTTKTLDTTEAPRLPDWSKFFGHPVVSLSATFYNNGILFGFHLYNPVIGFHSIKPFIGRFLSALYGVYGNPAWKWPDQKAIDQYKNDVQNRSGQQPPQGRQTDLPGEPCLLGYDNYPVRADASKFFLCDQPELLTHSINHKTLEDIAIYIYGTSYVPKTAIPRVLKALLWAMITKLLHDTYYDHQDQESHKSTLDEPYNVGPCLNKNSFPCPDLINTTVMARTVEKTGILDTDSDGLPSLEAIRCAYLELHHSPERFTDELVLDHLQHMKMSNPAEEYPQAWERPGHFRLVYEDFTELLPADWQTEANMGEESRLHLLPHRNEDVQKVRIVQYDVENKLYKVCFYFPRDVKGRLERILEDIDTFYETISVD